jgi:hypothetical protein
MTLRDLLRKKDKIRENQDNITNVPPIPQVTIIRSDTNTQEFLKAPSFSPQSTSLEEKPSPTRKSSTASRSSKHSSSSGKRLSSFLHLRSASHDKSSHIPDNLPTIEPNLENNTEEKEAQWEKRATILAQGNTDLGSSISSKSTGPSIPSSSHGLGHQNSDNRPGLTRKLSDAKSDVSSVTLYRRFNI